MSTFHVQRGIQFKPDLYRAPDRTAWFKALGDELATRKLSITLAPGLEIKNGDDAVKMYQRFTQDRAAFTQALALPAGTTLEGYFGDLVQALDDTVKTTTDVKDKVLDFGASSEMGKALGLDTKARYAAKGSPFAGAPAGQAFSVLGIQLSRTGAKPDPLAGKLFMDSTTFATMPAYQWARDSVELEQVMGVSGVSADALLDALRATNAAGRSTFQRLRKPELSEAYTIGYSGVALDEVKWDSDSHRTRESNKFVSLTIESGRYEPDAATGQREISVGTDKMDDTYYDTPDFQLVKADYSVRARARWDTDTEIRRILIGVKANSTVDDAGIKRCDKVDVRNDGASADEIASLDRDLRTGKTHWNGQEEAVKPLKGLYDGLAARGVLKDVGPHKGVLMLEPQVHIRSVRSRYHLNETDLSGIQNHFKQTSAKLADVMALATAAKAGLTGADLAAVEKFITDAQSLQDGTQVARLAEEGLKKLDPAMTVDAAAVQKLMPDLARQSWGSSNTNTQLSLDQKKVVADAMDKGYHDIAAQLDSVRRIITGSNDRALEPVAPMFKAWAQSVDKALLNKRTYDAFLARFDDIQKKPAAELQADLKAFNDFGEAQKVAGQRDFRDFKPLDEAAFKNLRPQLLNEVVRVNQRQLESAGTTAVTLWFDEAREFYVPDSSRNTGNFLIDTTDMSEYVKHSDWESIPADKRTPKDQLPRDKIFHATLVNETQIELGLEKPYLDRITAMRRDIRSDRASLIMKYLDAAHAGAINNQDPASYAAALKSFLGKPAAERDAFINGLNEFGAAQKSVLGPADAAALEAVEADLFTVANRDKAVRTEGTTERALAGAQFVFDQYMEIQRGVVKGKEDRIMRTLRNAGLQDGKWTFRNDSKGETAMKMLAGNT